MPVAAAVASGCDANTCRWSQEWQGDWQPGSGQSPQCSPCIMWYPDEYTNPALLTYYNGYQAAGWSSMFINEADWAVGQWSQLPYYSPSFDKCQGSSCSAYEYECNCYTDGIQYLGQQLPSNKCGSTTYTWINNGAYVLPIQNSYVYLNTLAPGGPGSAWNGYIDGPAKGSSASCDLRWSLLHETGHAFAEGHSSIATDVMYVKDEGVETIDGDAHDMMAQVYGSYEAGCSSNYCGGHADASLPPSPVTLHPISPAALERTTLAKADAAAAAAKAEAADANNIVHSQVGGRPQICSINCDPPPGGPAPTRPPLP